jgi:hypothetical protein
MSNHRFLLRPLVIDRPGAFGEGLTIAREGACVNALRDLLYPARRLAMSSRTAGTSSTGTSIAV